jgi:ubiquinone/menaquinone biosynthesis C-methylase UbiE
MNTVQPRVSEQSALWNGAAGRAWVESQELLDEVLQPFEDWLVAAVLEEAAASVLDVGCGTGSTTLALARRLGPSGRCTGVDISEPMIDAARTRAERERTPPAFVLADAQTYPFERASFDTVVSRFGVMFFEDPVQAFANLRRAAKDGARLRFVAWRSAPENPFMTAAERAAAPLLPDLPARRPDEPGQFAFADRERVRAILQEAGWSAVHIQPIDVACAMPETALVPYVTRMGPVGRALQQVDEPTRARVVEAVRAAFGPFVQGPAVRFTSASWSVAARV